MFDAGVLGGEKLDRGDLDRVGDDGGHCCLVHADIKAANPKKKL